jgi:hypothetical protein
MQKSDRYKEIVSWESGRVDAQRVPEQYTKALEKLEERKKFTKYSMVQVGKYGK